MRLPALLLLALVPCCAPTRGSPPPPVFAAAPPPGPAEPQPGAPSLPGGDWATCSASTDCALVVTRAGGCCDFGDHRAVNVRFQAEAERAWGPSAEELRAAEQREMTCTAGCAAPAIKVAACRGGSCVVTTAPEAPDGVSEAPAGGHLDRGPDGACLWWPSHCDNAPCTVATTRVRCPVPFVKR